MKLLFDFFPIILFFISYHQAEFLIENTFIGQLIDPGREDFITATIVATGVAIASSFLQVGINWIKTRRFEKMHLFSLGLITVLGGITIAFGNPAFVQWKPTVLNWLFAGVFFSSMYIGKESIVRRLMGGQIELPDPVWTKLNLSWVIFFIVSGAANLYVAFYYGLDYDDKTRMDNWVNFKLFGLMGLTIGFVILQAIFIAKYIKEEEEPAKAPEGEQ